jgi:hypothetical protein
MNFANSKKDATALKMGDVVSVHGFSAQNEIRNNNKLHHKKKLLGDLFPRGVQYDDEVWVPKVLVPETLAKVSTCVPS